MPPLGLARPDQNTREICVESFPKLAPKMIAQPLRVEFRVMQDLRLSLISDQVTERCKRLVLTHAAPILTKRQHIENHRLPIARQLHQSQIAPTGIELRRLGIKPQNCRLREL